MEVNHGLIFLAAVFQTYPTSRPVVLEWVQGKETVSTSFKTAPNWKAMMDGGGESKGVMKQWETEESGKKLLYRNSTIDHWVNTQQQNEKNPFTDASFWK